MDLKVCEVEQIVAVNIDCSVQCTAEEVKL
jgi:hypothetical protein